MKILVTGGGGFIGSHLCEKLVHDGHKVTIIDNFCIGRKSNLKTIKNKVKIFNKDIRNYDSIKYLFKKIDVVFHLAALADIVPSIENPDDYYRTNVTGTYNILKLSLENKVKRFIYTASSSCYGIPKNYPTKETEIISTKYPYALTKKIGEDLIVHWSSLFKIPFISLRLFMKYFDILFTLLSRFLFI